MSLTYMRTAVSLLAMQGCDGGYTEQNGVSVLYLDPDVISRHSLRAMEASLRTRLFFVEKPFKHMDEGRTHRRLSQWINSKTEFQRHAPAAMETLFDGLTTLFNRLQHLFLGEVGVMVSVPLASQQSNKEHLRSVYYIPMFTNEQDATLWNLCLSHMEQEINEPVYDQYHVQTFFGLSRT